ncbi:MAG TPA: hypothetical protein VMW27_11250, partial [Thermoanaerobaculia bacterium]|nr:hypothetical protein [Thermoanaerobaculia bacterium]
MIRMPSRWPLALLLLLATGTAHAAGEIGSVNRVDDAPSCMDDTPDVAPLLDGGFVAVWKDTAGEQPYGPARIQGRLLDRDGRPRGTAFRLDDGSTAPWSPDVATDVAGNFMVTWTAQSTGAIRGRVFSPSGAPLTTELDVAPPASYTTGPRIVAEREGGFTVLWHAATSLQRRRYTAGGQPLGPAEVLVSGPVFRDLSAAAHGDHGVVAVWTTQGLQVAGGIFQPGEAAVLFSAHIYSASAASRFYFEGALLAVASRPDDSFLVTWWDIVDNWPAVSTRAFTATGQPLGTAPLRVDDPEGPNFNAPIGLDATVDSDGNFVVGWQGGHAQEIGRLTIWTRTLSPDGTPRGPVVESAEASHYDPAHLVLAGGREGRALLLWQDGRPEPSLITTPILTCFSEGLYARPLFTTCPGGDRLCLQDGRFQVQVSWNLPDSQTGEGQPVRLTRESGYFWFFGENNVEVAVKILDGRNENGHFWVFYGSLSDVAYTITITDTATGATKTYTNPHSTLASRSDITAFPAAPSTASSSGSVAAESAPSHLPPADGAGPCTDPALPVVRRPGLCLNGQRFEVEVAWHDPFHGTSGIATGVPLTEDSGYFWFFGEDNLELVIKVLDGRTYNGKYWVFYGALSNVEYTIRVRHVDSGAERIYHNPPFEFRSRSDI